MFKKEFVFWCNFRCLFAKFVLAALILSFSQIALGGVKLGEQATMFVSVDENMDIVDMNDYIDGKPLVVIVSSCT